MRLTTFWTFLIAYMALAILLAGHISAWPWLGLLLGVAYRSFTGFYTSPVPAPIEPAWQGPHFTRRRKAVATAAARLGSL